mgnify:CR=1 FL=1
MIKYKDTRWMWLVLPFNASTGPLSTLITLQILTLGGNALDVSFAISLSNAVLIPSSLFWGFMADRMDRKKLILISMGGTSVSLLLMPLVNSIPLLSADYSLVTFMSTASTTPFNLLVMESAEKKQWGQLFSEFSFLSSLGMLIGLLISTVLVLFLKIYQIEETLGLIALITFVAGLKLIPKPVITFERVAILHYKESFMIRMRHLPMMFLHLPNPHSFKMFSLKRLRIKPTNYIPLLYLGIVIFYVSSGIFNTVYPAGLYVKGLDKSSVLIVITVGMIFQILGFKISERLLVRAEEKKIAHLSLLLRGVSYLSMGIVTELFFGFPVFISGLLFYP